MNFEGSYKINADIKRVWDNLNDPATLKKCIDGCNEFNAIGKDEYNATVNVKLGPVNAKFKSILKISDIISYKSYKITAEGNAGNLGFVSGDVIVVLKENNNNTILSYKANSKINGKIAQLGSRLIDGSVKKNTEKFFNNLEKTLLEKKNSGNTLNESINKKKPSTRKLFYLIIFFILLLIILNLIYG